MDAGTGNDAITGGTTSAAASAALVGFDGTNTTLNGQLAGQNAGRSFGKVGAGQLTYGGSNSG